MNGSWKLDLSWVTPQLAIGGRFPMEAAGHLAAAEGIGGVVDVRLEACDDAGHLRRCGLELLHLPTVDRTAVSQPMLDSGVDWVAERLPSGQRVLIHCEHGIGRSALLGLCVLVSRGLPPLEALTLAKGARVQVSPSPEQLGGFLEWSRRFQERTAPGWALPGLGELMQIAYRHLAEGELGRG